MKEFHDKASTRVDAEPRAVFSLITDVDRLPEWNVAIEDVQERPAVLSPGTQWTVKMHPPHMPSWGSISRVSEVDRAQLRFSYETRNTDGNPSYTTWEWEVLGERGGSVITVSWDVYLKTFDRRVLAGPLRKSQLRKEVTASLALLAARVGTWT
jgi:uncharacterized protein YndB with AHSA1/START domain